MNYTIFCLSSTQPIAYTYTHSLLSHLCQILPLLSCYYMEVYHILSFPH